jgi:hypothetical protein
MSKFFHQSFDQQGALYFALKNIMQYKSLIQDGVESPDDYDKVVVA